MNNENGTATDDAYQATDGNDLQVLYNTHKLNVFLIISYFLISKLLSF